MAPEQIVQEAISDLAAFVRCHESTFLYMVEKQHTISSESDHCYLKVDMYFTAIGMFSPPSEEELAAQMAEYAKSVGT